MVNGKTLPSPKLQIAVGTGTICGTAGRDLLHLPPAPPACLELYSGRCGLPPPQALVWPAASPREGRQAAAPLTHQLWVTEATAGQAQSGSLGLPLPRQLHLLGRGFCHWGLKCPPSAHKAEVVHQEQQAWKTGVVRGWPSLLQRIPLPEQVALQDKWAPSQPRCSAEARREGRSFRTEPAQLCWRALAFFGTEPGQVQAPGHRGTMGME